MTPLMVKWDSINNKNVDEEENENENENGENMERVTKVNEHIKIKKK